MRIVLVLATVLAAVPLYACGGEDEDLPDVDCSGTVPAFADVAALQKCATCHNSKLSGAARQAAPADINFDTEAAADKDPEKAAAEVNEGAMPPAGSGITLSAAEKEDFYKWALCR